MSHKKFGPDRFSRFDVYWIQTNKQTDKPNLYIDVCIVKYSWPNGWNKLADIFEGTNGYNKLFFVQIKFFLHLIFFSSNP